MSAKPLDPLAAPIIPSSLNHRGAWWCLQVYPPRRDLPPCVVQLWREDRTGNRVREDDGTEHYVAPWALREWRWYPISAWRQVFEAWERANGGAEP